jgi:NAD+ synthase
MEIDLSVNTDLVSDLLGRFIKSEVSRAGFSHALVALSGGLDSSLVCYLAARALGPQNLLAVRLPYKNSSPDSLEHAALVIEDLGIPSVTISITDMADGLIDRENEISNVRRGNILARCRMIVMYDQSEIFKGLVIGTGNKTEILLGYSTLYGDSACAINPVGDLYKTQIRQLAKAVGVPQPIIAKPPSADLWAGQTDEGELGLSYDQADRLLYLLVDQRYSPDECIQAGFEAAFLERVIRRIRSNHFKRIMPPIAKITSRTFGYDFLYLRDWGT